MRGELFQASDRDFDRALTDDQIAAAALVAAQRESALEWARREAWHWYDKHRDDVIKRFLFFTVKVHHAEFILRALFGDRPPAAA